MLDPQPARVHAREVEQVGRKLREPVHLLGHCGEELAPRRLVEILVLQELEEAAQREEGSPELVRGVGDEGAPRVVELREAAAHTLERPRELAQLVPPLVDDHLREVPARDPVGRPLEPADPAREYRGRSEPERDRGREGDQAGAEQAPLDEVDVGERVMEGRAQEQDAPLGRQRDGHLRVALLAALDGAAPLVAGDRGREREPVARDVRCVPALHRVVHLLQRGRRERQRPVEDDTCVRARRRGRDEVGVEPVVQVLLAQARRRAAQLRELRIDEPPLEARNEREVDDRERGRDDDRERQAQPRADAAERIHLASRKR